MKPLLFYLKTSNQAGRFISKFNLNPQKKKNLQLFSWAVAFATLKLVPLSLMAEFGFRILAQFSTWAGLKTKRAPFSSAKKVDLNSFDVRQGLP